MSGYYFCESKLKKKYFPCQDPGCREQSRAVFYKPMHFLCLGRLWNTSNRWLWFRRNSISLQKHGTSCKGNEKGLSYWLQEATLTKELLNVINCFQHSVPVPWVHLFTLQLVTTSTSCSLPGETELLLYRLAGNWSQHERVWNMLVH